MTSSRRLALAFAVVAIAFAATAAVLLSDAIYAGGKQLVSDLAFVLGAAFASASCLFTARRGGPRVRRPWRLLAATAAMWTIGNLWWLYYQFAADTQPYPSWADLFYLAALPFAIAALLNFPSARTRGLERLGMILDGLIVTGPTLFLSQAMGLGRLFVTDVGGVLASVVFLTYPSSIWCWRRSLCC